MGNIFCDDNQEEINHCRGIEPVGRRTRSLLCHQDNYRSTKRHERVQALNNGFSSYNSSIKYKDKTRNQL